MEVLSASSRLFRWQDRGSACYDDRKAEWSLRPTSCAQLVVKGHPAITASKIKGPSNSSRSSASGMADRAKVSPRCRMQSRILFTVERGAPDSSTEGADIISGKPMGEHRDGPGTERG